MFNFNGKSSESEPSVRPIDEFRAQRGLVAANESAEEIHLRHQQFLRAYNNPAVDVISVVERARILRDALSNCLESLDKLIKEHGSI